MDIKGYESLESLGIVEEGSDEFGFDEYERAIDGEICEILWVKSNPSTQPTIKRVFRDIRTLIGSSITGIQKVIEVNDGSDDSPPYIVYEKIEHSDSGLTRNDFAQCVDALDALKKDNWHGFILHGDTVIKDRDGEMKLRFVGLFELFQKRIIRLSRDGDYPDSKPKSPDDMRHLSSLFSEYFDEDSEFIFAQCQNKEYKKYIELQRDIKSLPTLGNPDYGNIQITGDYKKLGSLDALANELNKGCYWVVNGQLSQKNEEVEIQWSTQTISGKAYVQNKYENGERYGVLFIPHVNEQSDDQVIENGKKAKFNFENGNYKDRHYPIDFFYDEHENSNQLAELSNEKERKVSEWIRLPKAEKEYIEEKAFRKRYTEREPDKSNPLNIIFSLDGEPLNWEDIEQKKSDGVVLQVDGTRVGKILKYKSSGNRLFIKDFNGKWKKDIPSQGELIEDVKRGASQFRKQIDACEEFKKRNISNPELAALISTPDAPLPHAHINIDHDAFEPLDPDLSNDEMQKNAVVDAIHKKPIYLIQGPPGTGKTTVIVEIVQQLVKRNKETKILIVSHANMAVDNVLERLPPKDILFMRLASEHARGNDKILGSVREHIFETKLKEWITETEEKSKEYLSSVGNNADPLLVGLYTQYKRNKLSVSDFQKEYRQKPLIRSYAEKLFGLAKSKQDIEKVFRKELDEEYTTLKGIQDRWLAFIQNATSEKGGKQISMLKNGSEDIPMKVAYAKSMSVFGATCMHIASSTYSNLELQFDYMVMDEASQVTSARALVPINMAKNIILIGDHKQLPPAVTKDKKVRQKIKKDAEDDGLDVDKTYGTSLFEELFKSFEQDNNKQSYTTMLDIQYRMPRQLGHLISKYIYDGRLKNPHLEVSEYDARKSHNLNFKLESVKIEKDMRAPNSIVVVSTSKKDDPTDNGARTDRRNHCNVEAIKETLECLRRQHLDNEEVPKEIGIIAAYRGQVGLLKQKVGSKEEKYKPLSIGVDTVDNFQGSERDIIIYDLVRSSKETDSNIGFLDDYRRINVAFSRARKLLIVVGDSEFFIKRARPHPKSKVETKDLVIKNIMKQLQEWGCVHDSFNEALKHG